MVVPRTGPASGPLSKPASNGEKRFTIANIRKGLKPGPDKIFIYGVEAVGKTSFAAAAPAPIFIAVEDGVRNLQPVPDCVPEIRSYPDVLDALEMLRVEQHGYETVVIDTVDWLERMLKEWLCSQQTPPWSSEKFEAFGQGYRLIPDEWRRVINALDRLSEEKAMRAIVVAHARTRTFKNPMGNDWIKWEPNLCGDVTNPAMGSAIWKAWAHSVLFANYETGVAVHEKDRENPERLRRGKGYSTGRRMLYTCSDAAYDAKNRYDLPATLALSFAEYEEKRLARQPANPGDLLAETKELLAKWQPPEAQRKKTEAQIQAAEGDAVLLARAVDWLRTKVAEKEE